MRDTLRAPDAWVWAQRWLDVLFLHWRVPPQMVRPHLATGLEADTHHGDAWLSLVLFRLRVRRRWLPFVPGVSALTEMNLRTYVRHAGRAGIYFLSIHADNPLSVWLARRLTPLPYRVAPLTYRRDGDQVTFRSGGEQTLTLQGHLAGPPRPCAVGTLDAWLVERYTAFARCPRRGLVAGDVSHPPWTVQDVHLTDLAATGWGDVPGRPPDATHFGGSIDARFGPFRPAAACVESSRPAREREATA